MKRQTPNAFKNRKYVSLAMWQEEFGRNREAPDGILIGMLHSLKGSTGMNQHVELNQEIKMFLWVAQMYFDSTNKKISLAVALKALQFAADATQDTAWGPEFYPGIELTSIRRIYRLLGMREARWQFSREGSAEKKAATRVLTAYYQHDPDPKTTERWLKAVCNLGLFDLLNQLEDLGYQGIVKFLETEFTPEELSNLSFITQLPGHDKHAIALQLSRYRTIAGHYDRYSRAGQIPKLLDSRIIEDLDLIVQNSGESLLLASPEASQAYQRLKGLMADLEGRMIAAKWLYVGRMTTPDLQVADKAMVLKHFRELQQAHLYLRQALCLCDPTDLNYVDDTTWSGAI